MNTQADAIQSGLIECPYCEKPTRRIVVEVEKTRWLSFFVFGLLYMLLSPKLEKGFQCDLCGKTFSPGGKATRGKDRKIALLLSGFSLLIIFVILMMFVTRVE